MSESAIKKSVSYKLLVRTDANYFNLGTFIIKTGYGDLHYVPSTPNTIESDIVKQLDHISWHLSGQVHLKYKNHNTLVIGNHLPLSDVGYQGMINDTILDCKKLPKYLKKIKEIDVVFDIGQYKGPVELFFSVVSGKLIVARAKGMIVPIMQTSSNEDKSLIQAHTRAVGHHSGIGDLALQFSIRKTDANNLKTNRRIYFPPNAEISKSGY